MSERKNPHAVALGRRRAATAGPEEMARIASDGGKAGGPARAASLTAARRKEIARKAAAARWANKAEK